MLTAIMSDIHGNREALAACVAHAERLGIDRIIYLGDYVGYGADPGWVLETVQGHVREGAIALLGNHDEAIVGSDEDMNSDARAAIRWTRRELSESARVFLAGLPLMHRERHRLFAHANGHAPGQWAYIQGPIEAEWSLRRTDARIMICGHVHVPALYAIARGKPTLAHTPGSGVAVPLLATRQWLCTIGAVGQPRDGNPAAAYALLDDERDTLTSVRVPYDIETAAQKILAAGLPLRFAARLHLGR
ncbi:MAG TPA: metallophosphoesterase family protein [Beijerinckiaceae bacterium]|jgi:diadenosine tetraphosphatase ApaH/serine/threonine PP2A family protein phosphatase|nr:metallophosphoesterase family protein [Beijerinckiaceae bacterium]